MPRPAGDHDDVVAPHDKRVTRFGELVEEGAEDPKNRYRLWVIASDVTHRRMLVLPDNAGHLGIQPDDMAIGYAIRMGMSIPVFFEPVVHKSPRERRNPPDRRRRHALQLPRLIVRLPLA